MLRPRGGSSAISTKATAQTLCQKCLKRGHYSFDCKANPQDRPYIARPSRTQQLANPDLTPKLSSDAPNDLLRKKGIADEELAKKEAERSANGGFARDNIKAIKGPRSARTSSSTSVSAISTSRSRSSSPTRGGKNTTGQSQMLSNLQVGRKRRRSSSSLSYGSQTSYDHARQHDTSGPERSRKASNFKSARGNRSQDSRSVNSSDSGAGVSRRGDQGKRRRRSSRSPTDRGRHRDSHTSWTSRRTRSPNGSRDRSHVVRNRKSMTPSITPLLSSASEQRHGRPSFDRNSSYSDDHERYGRSARFRNSESARAPPHRQDPLRQRSLSPFSKRLAMTQAMNNHR